METIPSCRVAFAKATVSGRHLAEKGHFLSLMQVGYSKHVAHLGMVSPRSRKLWTTDSSSSSESMLPTKLSSL